MYAYADADTELSPRMTLTAEGFLVCRDAVLARTGEQEYHAVEIPTLDADTNGWIIVTRPEREVFDRASLRSYAGKPLVLNHPEGEDAFVHSENVRQLQIGSVLNARRGEGNLHQCVLGDLMITNRPAIEMIRRGTHRSLSVGYDAEYSQREPGRATQHRIRVNHLALLPTGTARCGPQCQVRDHQPQLPTPRGMSPAMRQAKQAHERWSRERMQQLVAAQKTFWAQGSRSKADAERVG
jgi:hypothetical protein